MITVDCHEVESIQNELLIYVADNIGFIYALDLNSGEPVSYTHLTLPTTPYV